MPMAVFDVRSKFDFQFETRITGYSDGSIFVEQDDSDGDADTFQFNFDELDEFIRMLTEVKTKIEESKSKNCECVVSGSKSTIVIKTDENTMANLISQKNVTLEIKEHLTQGDIIQFRSDTQSVLFVIDYTYPIESTGRFYAKGQIVTIA